MHNILVVDDDKNITDSMQMLLTAMLRKKGVDVSIDKSYSGKEAKEKIQNKYYHIVITDLNLGDANGIEMSKECRQENQIFYFCSGEVIDMSLLTEIDRFLTKPSSTAEIIAYILKDINSDSSLKVA